jgi:FtsP/CotA-like multicopper oxidase with cupredoxin domain
VGVRTGLRRVLVLALTVAAATIAASQMAAVAQAPTVETTFPTTQGQPFAEPPSLRSANGVLAIDLRVTETTYDVAGTPIVGQAYDGRFVGPTLRVRPGDRIEMTFRNELDEPTNIHFHGFRVSPSGIADNVLRIIPARTTAPVRVDLPSDLEPGTYWYHSHPHGDAEGQVMAGLAGVIVVEGEQRFLPANLQGVTERVLALKDLQASNGAALTSNIDSNAPTTRTVNGQVNPVIPIRPDETQLWRLANISADIWYKLQLDGARFQVIGQDGSPVAKVSREQTLLLPPGKRYDVLLQGPKAGSYRLRTLRYSTGPAGDDYPERTLATLTSAGQPVQPAKLPAGQDVPALLRPRFGGQKVDRKRKITFSERGNDFFINGKKFNHNRIDARIRLGDLEEWTIRNRSGEQHPFHIHVQQFQVMSVNGRKVKAEGLQDTVPLPVGGSVVIRIRFLDFTGKFPFHCHILNHEDNGMMALVEVVDADKNGGGGNADDAAAAAAPPPPAKASSAAPSASAWPLRGAPDLLCPLPAARGTRTGAAALRGEA